MKRTGRNNKKQHHFSVVFPIVTIIAIGIIIAFTLYYTPAKTYPWTEIRKEIKDSIQLAELSGITNGVGGFGVSTEHEVDRRRWIMKNATESELLKLTEYPNGSVRAIAYEGLLRKKKFAKRTELVLRAMQDTTYQLRYQSGCLAWSREIGEYLVQDVLMIDDQIPPFPPDLVSEFGLTEPEKEKLLSEFRKRSKGSL